MGWQIQHGRHFVIKHRPSRPRHCWLLCIDELARFVSWLPSSASDEQEHEIKCIICGQLITLVNEGEG